MFPAFFPALLSCRFQKMCMEPTSFTVKEESQFKGGDTEFVKTKLMTRLTYTLDEVRAMGGGHVRCTMQYGTTAASLAYMMDGARLRGSSSCLLGYNLVGLGDGTAMACVVWPKGWKHSWDSWDCGGCAEACGLHD